MSTAPEGKEVALAGCPFCSGPASIRPVARSWWKIELDHEDGCMLLGHFDEAIVPQDDESKAELIARWNRRAATPSALSAAPEGEVPHLPTYGTLPWATVRAYVRAANGAAPIVDPEYFIGHQVVGINFNSLNRIMSALAAPQSPAPEAVLVDAAAGYFLRAGFDPSGDGTKRWEQVADEFKNDADVVPLFERATLSAGKGGM